MILLVALLAPLALLGAAQTLAILPSAVELTGPEARQQLIAEATVRRTSGRLDPHGRMDIVRTRTSPPSISTGMVTPVADGEADITARQSGAALPRFTYGSRTRTRRSPGASATTSSR